MSVAHCMVKNVPLLKHTCHAALIEFTHAIYSDYSNKAVTFTEFESLEAVAIEFNRSVVAKFGLLTVIREAL